jgi:hypothetical protein
MQQTLPLLWTAHRCAAPPAPKCCVASMAPHSPTCSQIPPRVPSLNASCVVLLQGEKLLVTSTDLNYHNAEELVVESVTARGSGSQVRVKGQFKKSHFGALQQYSNKKGRTWQLDERAEVGGWWWMAATCGGSACGAFGGLSFCPCLTVI